MDGGDTPAVEYHGARDKLVALGRIVPPPLSPLWASDDGGAGTDFVAEAGIRGISVNAWLGHVARYRTWFPGDRTKRGGYEQHEYVMAFSDVLKASDIAICRPGSGSLWELVLTGTPHLAVPLPLSVSRGDQIENCRHFASLGATRWMDQDTFLATPLAPALRELWDERDTIRAAMRALAPGRPATQAVSDIPQGQVQADRVVRRIP